MANTQKKKTGAAKNKSSAKSSPAPKKTPAKKEPEKKEVSTTVKRQKTAIILMAAAVFLLCVAFIEGESIWLSLHEAMFGIFGFCAYILPVVLIYMAIIYAKDKPLGSVAANLTGTGVFVALLSGAIHIFANSAEYLSETGLAIQVSDSWNKISSLSNGGVIGAVIGRLLSWLFGKTGAGITIVLLLVVLAMFLTGTTLLGLLNAIRKPVKRVGELTNEKLEQNAIRREQLEQEREKEKEKEQNKKAFNPPKQQTVAVEKFEDNFITDESTFAPVDNTPMPEIPVVKLPDAQPTDIIEETIEAAVEEEKPKKKKKAPAVPDGEPLAEQVDIPVETLPESEPEKSDYIFPSIELLNIVEKDGATDSMT
ncbi:MAG: DNA translocase FtsK 4TM domain-containing protein [Clostridia bacterium]|nr:DNA translocase FtsK 4TM domain-containing protein [Clostridia bacterium]